MASIYPERTLGTHTAQGAQVAPLVEHPRTTSAGVVAPGITWADIKRRAEGGRHGDSEGEQGQISRGGME